jgi:hypothetical protein
MAPRVVVALGAALVCGIRVDVGFPLGIRIGVDVRLGLRGHIRVDVSGLVVRVVGVVGGRAVVVRTVGALLGGLGVSG